MKFYISSVTFILLLCGITACSTIDSDPRAIKQSENTIETQFRTLAELARNADQTSKKISAWSSYQHIEHILLVKREVALILAKAERTESVEKKNKMAVFKTLRLGSIERGTLKAPERLQPKGLNKAELRSLIKNTALLYKKLNYKEFFNSSFVPGNHPYLGGLTSAEWLRFVEVHTRHHLKIIRDIQNYKSATSVIG